MHCHAESGFVGWCGGAAVGLSGFLAARPVAADEAPANSGFQGSIMQRTRPAPPRPAPRWSTAR